MSRLTDFFKTEDGAKANRAVARVFSGAAVAAAMTVLQAPAAHAFPSMTREAPYVAPVASYHIGEAFERKAYPLKQQIGQYEDLITGYGQLLEKLRDVTYDQGSISGKDQIAIYRNTINDWIADSRKEWKQEDERVDAVPASVKGRGPAEILGAEYQRLRDQNTALRLAVEQMTKDLTVIVVYGDAGVDDVSEAFKSFADFEELLVDLEVVGPAEVEEDVDAVSAPRR